MMLKNISNFGSILSKSEQKIILGGDPIKSYHLESDLEPCKDSVCYEDINVMCNHACCTHLITLGTCPN